MASNFPTALDGLLTNQPYVDGSTVIAAAALNNIQDAVDKVQTKVGKDNSTIATSLDFALRKAYVKVSDVKINADGDALTTNTWVKRTLNTEDNDAGNLCSLSSNQITLAAGTYRCCIHVPAFQAERHCARLYNATAASVVIMGTAMYNYYDYANAMVCSEIVGQFVVAANQALEVQHYCTVGRSNSGGQKVFSDSTPNVYTVAEFWKIA